MTKLYRMTHVRPLGRAIPVDVELLAGLGDRGKEIAMFSDWQRDADYPEIHLDNQHKWYAVGHRYPPPVDVWELDRQAMLREMQTPRWKKVLVWLGMVAFCAVAWAGIIWLAVQVGKWLAGVGR